MIKAAKAEAEKEENLYQPKKVKLPQQPEHKDNKYKSIYQTPYIKKGKVIDAIGSSALHISLGVEKNVFKLTEFDTAVAMEDATLLSWFSDRRLSGGKLNDLSSALSNGVKVSLSSLENARKEHERVLTSISYSKNDICCNKVLTNGGDAVGC